MTLETVSEEIFGIFWFAPLLKAEDIQFKALQRSSLQNYDEAKLNNLMSCP